MPNNELSEILHTYPEINKLIMEKDAKIADLEEQLRQATEALELIQAQPANAPSTLPTVEVNKSTFQFTAPKFSYKGESYEAAEAATNKKLCAELVQIGAGILKKIEA
jgi:hypothetical protein